MVTFLLTVTISSEPQRPYCPTDFGKNLGSQAQTSRGKSLDEVLTARLRFVTDIRHPQSLETTVRGAGGFGSTGGFGPAAKKQKVEEEIVETTTIKRKEI